jgi:hypothetical protein
MSTTEEVVDELLATLSRDELREQMLAMARYGDMMRAQRDRLEAELVALRGDDDT